MPFFASIYTYSTLDYVIEDFDLTKNRLFVNNQAIDRKTLIPRQGEFFHWQDTVNFAPYNPTANLYDAGHPVTLGKYGSSSVNDRNSGFGALGVFDPWLSFLDYNTFSSRYFFDPFTGVKYILWYNDTPSADIRANVWSGHDMAERANLRSYQNSNLLTPLYLRDDNKWIVINHNWGQDDISALASDEVTWSSRGIRSRSNAKFFFIGTSEDGSGWILEYNANINHDYSVYKIFNENAVQVIGDHNVRPPLQNTIYQYPSNLRHDTRTRKVFYSSHFTEQGILQPIRYVWNRSDTGMLTTSTCTMIHEGQAWDIASKNNWVYFAANASLQSTVTSIMSFGNEDWTVEAWIMFTDIPSTDDWWPTSYTSNMTLICVGTTSVANGFSCIFTRNYMACQSNDQFFRSNLPHMMIRQVWYHTAFVRNGNAIYFYVDGKPRGSAPFNYMVGTGANIYIGNETVNGAYFNGHISNLRVVKGKAVYRGPFTVPIPPLQNTQTSSTNIIELVGTETHLLTCNTPTIIPIDTSTYIRPMTTSLNFVNTGAYCVHQPPQNSNYNPNAYANFWYKPHQFTKNGINYITFCTSEKSIHYSFTERWDTRGMQRTWITYTIDTAPNDHILRFHSSYHWPTIWDFPRSWVPADDAGDRLYIFVTGRTLTFDFDPTPGMGWKEVHRVSIDTRSYGIDSTGRLWCVTRSNAHSNQTGGTADGLTGDGYNRTYIYNPYIKSDNINITIPPNVANTFTGQPIQTYLYVSTDNKKTPYNYYGQPRPNDQFGQTGTGWSWFFDGAAVVGDRIVSMNHEDFNFRLGDFTVEFWTNLVTAIGSQPYAYPGFVGQKAGDATRGWQFWRPGNNKMGFRHYGQPTTWDLNSFEDVDTNIWQHWAVTRKDGIISLFKNGRNQGYIGSSQDFNDPASHLMIGYSETWGHWLKGFMSDVRICKGLAVYSTTTNAWVSTFNNSDRYAFVTPWYTGTNYFALEMESSDFTIEFFWYPSATTRQVLYHNSVGVDFSLAIDYSNNSQKLGLWVSSNGTSWDLITAAAAGNGVGTTNVPQYTWNHIAVTRSGTTWTMWLNGRIDKQITGVGGTIVRRPGYIKGIGHWAAYATVGRPSGYMSNFRITKGYALYDNTFTPTAPLYAVTGTVLMTLNTNTFYDMSTISNTVTTFSSMPMEGYLFYYRPDVPHVVTTSTTTKLTTAITATLFDPPTQRLRNTQPLGTNIAEITTQCVFLSCNSSTVYDDNTFTTETLLLETNTATSGFAFGWGTSSTSVIVTTTYISPIAVPITIWSTGNYYVSASNVDSEPIPPSWYVKTSNARYGPYRLNSSISLEFTATSIHGISSYAITTGTFPLGLNLNTATGEVTGNTGNTATIYSFTLRAIDVLGQSVDQQFEVDIRNPVLATGGIEILTTSGYKFHVYTGTEFLQVAGGGIVDVLVVGGGGAGGANFNSYDIGGGGGGGAIWVKNISINPGTIPVVVGYGGQSSYPDSPPYKGNNGLMSSFDTNWIANGGEGGAQGRGGKSGSGRLSPDGVGGEGGGGAVSPGGLDGDSRGGGAGLYVPETVGIWDSDGYFASGGAGYGQVISGVGWGYVYPGGGSNFNEPAKINSGGGGAASSWGNTATNAGADGIVIVRYMYW